MDGHCIPKRLACSIPKRLRLLTRSAHSNSSYPIVRHGILYSDNIQCQYLFSSPVAFPQFSTSNHSHSDVRHAPYRTSTPRLLLQRKPRTTLFGVPSQVGVWLSYRYCWTLWAQGGRSPFLEGFLSAVWFERGLSGSMVKYGVAKSGGGAL